MQLYSEESIIMNLTGFIEKKVYQKKFYEATDYKLKLKIKALKQDKEIEENFELQMITKDSQNFDYEMKRIVNFLELDKYSNNNKEHLINLKIFMKKYYPAIVFMETQKKTGDPRKASCF